MTDRLLSIHTPVIRTQAEELLTSCSYSTGLRILGILESLDNRCLFLGCELHMFKLPCQFDTNHRRDGVDERPLGLVQARVEGGLSQTKRDCTNR